MTLEEARNAIGCEVEYIPYEGCSKEQIEHGIIKSVNDHFVFVQFAPRTMNRAEACNPSDLRRTIL